MLAMDYKALKKFCKENDLETKAADHSKDEVDDFRKEVAEEIDVTVLEEAASGETDPGDTPDDKYTWKDLEECDWDELEDLIDEEKLDADPDDFDKDTQEDKLRRAIAKELKVEAPKKKKK